MRRSRSVARRPIGDTLEEEIAHLRVALLEEVDPLRACARHHDLPCGGVDSGRTALTVRGSEVRREVRHECAFRFEG